MLPKWLAGIALLLGVIAVTPIGFVAFIAMALWIPITSILLALRASAAARRPPQERIRTIAYILILVRSHEWLNPSR